jgi:hypothetical protein
MFDDAMHVRVWILEQLVQPMDGFHVRIAPHLAEDGRAFDGFVSEAVEFSEESRPFDFGHDLF